LIEHHLPFVLEHCDALSVLELGSTIARATPKEIMSNDVVRDFYLS